MPLRYVLFRYALVSAVTIVAVLVAGLLLETFFGLSIGAGVSAVSAMVPALDAGQSHARGLKRMPDKGYMWKMSALFVPINALVGAIVVLPILMVSDGVADVLSALSYMPLLGWAAIMAVVFVIYWLSGRFFFGFGAKNELKQQEKLAAKK